MNILIPHKWLLEHLDTDATPEEIQEKVSLCGPSIERIYDIEGDKVYDIEVTTNRVDAMSIRGIARETAVILEQFGVNAKLKPSNLLEKSKIAELNTNSLPLPKITNDPKLSKRLTCVVLSGVKRNPTPIWMADRLIQTEQNVHDSVIDITNYITHDLGHPCHAFDYNKLMNTGGEIIVEEAKAGEKFETLDGLEFETVGGEVVFKNGEGDIIDLPSIKGTANTSIDDSTTNVLLLLESIKAEKVRFASMTHAIRTVAAQLMEKNVDPHLAQDVLIKGIELYQDLCDATVASEIFDEFPGSENMAPVKIDLQRIHDYLGINIELEKVVSILEQLECRVETGAEDSNELTVHPPTFRPDITIPADIIEEIARIYGYHNLPSVIMDTTIPTNRQENVDFSIENRIKRHLSSVGLQEIYSYSMVSEEIALEKDSLENHLKLQNPLSDDRVYLRKSLVPSLNEISDQNSQVNELAVFEIANVYLPRENDLPEETLRLTIVAGNENTDSITNHYRKVRGILEDLLAKFFINDVSVNQTSDSTGIVQVGENTNDGKTQTAIGSVEILPKNRVAIEIEFVKLLNLLKTHPTYKAIPKTGTITEDMTFTLPEKSAVGEVIQTIKNISEIITNVELSDIYNQNYSFKIWYHNPMENLSATDVEPIRKEVAQILESKHSAKLIGAV